jgi:hypothetical protein
MMKGNQGMPVADCAESRKAAVKLNAGANQCQMMGRENCFFGLTAYWLSISDLIASSVAAF